MSHDGTLPAQDHLHGIHPSRRKTRGTYASLSTSKVPTLIIRRPCSQTLDPKDPLLAGLEHEEIVIPSESGVTLRGFGIRREGDVERNTESRRAVVIYFQGEIRSLRRAYASVELTVLG